jgi:hypothetical protein
MSVRFADREERRTPRPVLLPVRRTVPGFSGTQVLTAISDNIYVVGVGSNGSVNYTLSNAVANVSLGCIFLAGASEYNPDFVAEVLSADAARPEAEFDNVVDMLDWLNRE